LRTGPFKIALYQRHRAPADPEMHAHLLELSIPSTGRCAPWRHSAAQDDSAITIDVRVFP